MTKKAPQVALADSPMPSATFSPAFPVAKDASLEDFTQAMRPTLKIKRLHPDASLPVYATPGAACFDLAAHGCHEQGVYVKANTPQVFGTGLSVEVPDGWVMLIFSRSGHGFKNNARLANCVGVIDSDYRGEIKVKLTMDGERSTPMCVKSGERIAQALLMRVEQWDFELVEDLSETERGEGGLGSTGA